MIHLRSETSFINFIKIVKVQENNNIKSIELTDNKKVYFLADAHLGIKTKVHSEIEREKILVNWLDKVKSDAHAIFLMGDIFDFWFEYKRAIPKGFTRFLGKICELTDNGLPVYYFTGNHDMWTFGYFEKEMGLKVFNQPMIIEINRKKFYIAHGDGLGSYDRSYNFLKKIFRNRFFQFLFRIIHPDCGIKIAQLWSSGSRNSHKYPKNVIPENEWLVKYAQTVLKTTDVNYFVFGHRHIAFQYELGENCVFTNLGDWVKNFSYAVFDGEKFELKFFLKDHIQSDQ